MATTTQQYPLEKSKVAKRFLNSIKAWLILDILAAAGAVFLLNASIAAAFAIFAGFLVPVSIWQWVYESKYFEAYYYDVGNDFLTIKKGWITPREAVMPYEKLQDVYVDQDLLDRMFGLWDVHVSTATVMSGIEAHIDGVSSQNANALRELILNKIRSKRSKVTGYD